MIFNLTMKTPDAADSALEGLEGPYCTPEERVIAKQMLSSVLEYGKYLTIRVDTKARTFTVLKTSSF